MTDAKKRVQNVNFLKDVFSLEEARFWFIKEYLSTRLPQHSEQEREWLEHRQ